MNVCIDKSTNKNSFGKYVTYKYKCTFECTHTHTLKQINFYRIRIRTHICMHSIIHVHNTHTCACITHRHVLHTNTHLHSHLYTSIRSHIPFKHKHSQVYKYIYRSKYLEIHVPISIPKDTPSMRQAQVCVFKLRH